MRIPEGGSARCAQAGNIYALALRSRLRLCHFLLNSLARPRWAIVQSRSQQSFEQYLWSLETGVNSLVHRLPSSLLAAPAYLDSHLFPS